MTSMSCGGATTQPTLRPEIFANVQKPYQYLGHEENTYNKDFDAADVRFCIAFPDAYEIGAANVGMQIIYHVLNEQPDFMSDRVFTPLVDMGDALQKAGVPLSGRESQRPLREFDCIGFTLQYELCYTNLLYMLDLAKIPQWAKDRGENDPLICAGGPCAFNVEPVADFLDFVVLGEGEEVVIEVADCLKEAKQQKLSRQEKLLALSKIKGIYIPSFYTPEYDAKGSFVKLVRGPHAPRFVERRIIADLNSALYPTAPVTPSVKPVHERVSVEIQRGCTRSCRFCQAGYVYRPRRERNPQKIVDIIAASVKNTGIHDIGLLSLSSADYSQLHPVMRKLMDRYKKEHMSISLPSTRLEALKVEYLDVLKEERRAGFTIAPEAGSQRMRNVINKNFTEQEVIDTVKLIFENGWQSVKLYFMIGLPTETDDDVRAIAELGNACHRATSNIPGRKSITVSVSNFVPKPHTPFQWHEQITHEEIKRKQKLIRDTIKYPKNITFRTHNADNSFAEGIVARGSRMTSLVIKRAYDLGARFDCWQEKFDLKIWKQALAEIEAETGVDLAHEGLRGRSFEERLPWHRLYSGIHPKFFKNEFNKAVYGVATEDCSFESCHECGLCNERSGVAPIVVKESRPLVLEDAVAPTVAEGAHVKTPFRFQYQKVGPAVYLSTLDLQGLLLRALKRAEILVVFDNGMRPRPKLSMGPALPLGVSSRSELLDIWLETNLSAEKVIQAINQFLPPHVHFLTGKILEKDDPTISETIKAQSFKINMQDLPPAHRPVAYDILEDQLAKIRAVESFQVQRKRANREGVVSNSVIDLKKHLIGIRLDHQPQNAFLEFSFAAQNGQTVSPFIVLDGLFGDAYDWRLIPVHKIGFSANIN